MIHTEPFGYVHAHKPYEGTLSYDNELSGKRPTVLVCHAYSGQLGFDTNKAEALAKLGYIGIAIDVYGKGLRATTAEEATALMAPLNEDRVELLGRLSAALDAVSSHSLVDSTRIAAIGFCFGGKCVLDMARANLALRAVVSFHGVYQKPNCFSAEQNSAAIRPAILVLHGWDDPLATPQQTVQLANELTQRKADWQIHAYGGTCHAFTKPEANAKSEGKMYNPKADRRAWQAMKLFLDEMLD